MQDNVNHPKHYCNHASGRECIEISGLMNFALGNAFKYLFRCGDKGTPVEDLKKAIWYLNYELQQREKLWIKFDDDFYDARLDGCPAICEVLDFEHRYCGHMRSALERIYAAFVCRRSRLPVRKALYSVEQMIRIQEWKEAQGR